MESTATASADFGRCSGAGWSCISAPYQNPGGSASEGRAAAARRPIAGYLFDAANLLSLAGLLGSTAAITFAVRGNFPAAAIGLLAAYFFDVVDGVVAKRLTGRTPADRAFGANLDSLVDMVTAGAGLAVLLLAYGEYEIAYIPGAFALLGAAALRLSYFNVHGMAEGTTSYVGLPADQAVLAFTAVMLLEVPLEPDLFPIVLYGFAIALAGLMVSPVRVPKASGAAYYGLMALAFAIAVLHAVRLMV